MRSGSGSPARRVIFILVVTLLAAAWPSSSALAVGTSFQEFQIPCGLPGDLTTGPDGNLWILTVNPDQVLRMTPDGTFTAFPIPGSTSVACGGPPQSNLWPTNIVAGGDGNLWFTEGGSDSIVRVTMAGVMTVFQSPYWYGLGRPWGIASGPDCNIWFTDYSASRVGRVSPDGSILEFPISGYSPIGITTGPDGNIWFALEGGGIGQMAPDGGSVVRHPTTPPTFGNPTSIATGSDGNLWFIDKNHSIGRMTTSGVQRYFPISPVPSAFSDDGRIVAGPDGALWFDDYANNAIGRMDTSGAYEETTPPSSGPGGVAVGPDGNIWFLEFPADRVAVLRLANPTPPGAPWTVKAAAHDGRVTVTWTVPMFDGRSPITGYRITPYIGSSPQPPIYISGAATTTATVSGLDSTADYGFEVSAMNSLGLGPGTRTCAPVTPGRRSSAPVYVTASYVGGGQAAVSWTPVSDGGNPVTYYAVYAYPPIAAGVLVTPNANSLLVSGLSQYQETFAVAAYNGRWSQWSDWSPPLVTA